MVKEFEIENGFLSKYNGTGPVAVILDSVREICMRAFENCGSLRKIVIPDSVTAIWPKAFQNCPQLTEFSFGKNLKEVWANAFEDTPWFQDQPDGVIYIGDLAYAWKGELLGGDRGGDPGGDEESQ